MTTDLRALETNILRSAESWERRFESTMARLGDGDLEKGRVWSLYDVGPKQDLIPWAVTELFVILGSQLAETLSLIERTEDLDRAVNELLRARRDAGIPGGPGDVHWSELARKLWTQCLPGLRTIESALNAARDGLAQVLGLCRQLKEG